MSEDDWLASRHGRQMLVFVLTATTPIRTRWLGWREARRFAVGERKVRLVEVACCERVADLVPSIEIRNLIAVARSLVEDRGNDDGWGRARAQAALEVIGGAISDGGVCGKWNSASFEAVDAVSRLFCHPANEHSVVLESAARARADAVATSEPSAVYERRLHQALVAEQARQADLVREVIGNPFRPASIDPAWLTANDHAAARIAEGIASARVFADLPILADALEDAGCTSRAVLDHCRTPGSHGVGCWVLDLLLGKS